MLSGDDDLGLDFNLGPEDLKVIEEQETQFVTQQHGELQPLQIQQRIMELESQRKVYASELEQIQKEKMIREGEISLLRQKLNHLETEKYEASKRYAEKLELLEQEKQAMIQHWQRELERLKTELQFSKIESKPTTLSSSVHSSSTFASNFDDLTSNLLKRPKLARPLRVEASCEVDSCLASTLGQLDIEEDDKPLDEFELESLLFRSIGYADKVIANEAIYKDDRIEIKTVRDSIQEMVNMTQNPLLAIESMYSKYSQTKKNAITHYILTILITMLSLNRNVGRHIGGRTRTLINSPSESHLISDLCTFLRNLPDGVCCTLVHDHFLIFKYLLLDDERKSCPINSEIFSLLEDGTLLCKFHSFNKNENPYLDRLEIIWDVIHLINMMIHDTRFSMVLMKQIQGIDLSLLNKLNDILVKRLLKKPYHFPYCPIEKGIVNTLYRLVVDRVLPASVSFEPITVKTFARRLSQIACNDNNVNITALVHSDILVMFQILHQILVVEKAPVVRLLVRDFISLCFACRRFLEDPTIKAGLQEYLDPMISILDSEMKRVLAGEYLPIPMPTYICREIPLTEEEEWELYKKWEEDGLIKKSDQE